MAPATKSQKQDDVGIVPYDTDKNRRKSDSMTPRKAAVLSLNSAVKNGRFVNLELDSSIKKYGFEDKDKSFFTFLLYGTVERKITLDYIIKKLSSVAFEKIEPMVLCILETGLFQIFFMDRVPDSAACNEATELVKTMCPKSYAGYVNGVMRSAVRQKQEIVKEIASLKGNFGISIKYSVPEWLCELWDKDYGCAENIVKALCEKIPHVTLRVNTLKIQASELCEKLDKSAHAKVLSDCSVSVSGASSIPELYGYNEGLFFVQDIASTLCSSLVSKESVKTKRPIVVDTCSCPGGKSFSAAINLGNECEIHSFDLHKNRLSLVNGGAERLGLKSIVTEARDGRTPDENLFGKADAVICDVPCSGLGVIAKKPDIRYKKKEDIEKLPEVQRAILEASSNYVKKGGFIVYSTCTLNRAENEDVVEAFLKEHNEFSLCPTGLYGEEKGMVTFLPHKTGTDGFFAAKLVRK